jgi:hypothetical protein
MAASQKGFCSYKLSILKKTNIIKIMTEILQFLFFYHREIVKLDHFIDTFLEICKHRLQNPPFCISTTYRA